MKGIAVKTLACLLGAALISKGHGVGCPDTSGTWTGQAMLDSSISYQAQWRIVTEGQDELLELALSGESQGWLGFGFGEPTSGSMLGADIVSVSVDTESCQVEVKDWYVPWVPYPFAPFTGGPENPYPVLDTDANGGCSNWEAISGVQENGCTRAVVRRKLSTGDAFDREIILGESNRVMWAHRADSGLDAMAYHGPNRGTLSIDFGGPALSSNQALQDLMSGCPDCIEYGLTMNNVLIPAQETSYICEGFEVNVPSEVGPQGVHIIGMFVEVDNAPFVHHLIVHSCDNDSFFQAHFNNPQFCGGNDPGSSPLASGCQSLIYAWAVGGKPVILPQEAGVRVSNTINKRIMVEVHYNNPAKLENQRDSSSFKVVVSPTLRQHDAAVLVVGDPHAQSDPLPAGEPQIHRVGECSSECTSTAIPANEKVTVFASFPHMHAFGKQIWTNVYDSNMNFKRNITEVDFWNFEFQDTFQLDEPVEIDSGDSLFTHCSFDTSTQQNPVQFGSGSLDEMCMDFLYAYPVRYMGDGQPWTLCGMARGLQGYINELGQSISLPPGVTPEDAILQHPYLVNTGFGSMCNNDVSQSYTEALDISHSGGTTTINLPVNRRDDRVWDESASKYNHDVEFSNPLYATNGQCAAQSGNSVDAAACQAGPTQPPAPSSGCDGDADYPFQIEPLGSGTASLKFCWKLPEIDQASGECRLGVRLQAEGQRWLSFGLGNEMPDSVAIVGSDNGVTEHEIGARRQDAITTWTGTSGVVESTWETSAGSSVLVMTLRSIGGRPITSCDPDSGQGRLLATDFDQPAVFAVGYSTAFGIHEAAVSRAVAWSTGALSEELTPTSTDLYLQIHVFLMSAVFAILMPALVLLPLCKTLFSDPSRWFAFHRGVAVLALALTIAGLAVAVLYTEAHFSETHHLVGVVAISLLCANPVLGILRPDKNDAGRRATWLIAHRCVGFGALLAGPVAILLGAKLVTDRKMPEFFGEQSFSVAIIIVSVAAAAVLVGQVLLRQSGKPSLAVVVADSKV